MRSTTPAPRLPFLGISTTLALSLARCGDEGSGGPGTGTSVTITAPVIVSPNAQSPLTDNQPSLTVVNVTVSSGTTPTYSFQVAPDQGFSSIVVQSSGIVQGSGQTSWKVTQPLPDGDYFWRARAEASGAFGPFSTVAQFKIAAPGSGPGETLVLFDDLTDGSSLATDGQGGTFTAQGWRVNENGDFLRYEVPTVESGYVQWQNLGLTPRGLSDDSHLLFGMWDPTAGNYRSNPFRVHIQKLWANPHNPPFIRLRWISHGRQEEDGFNFTDWDRAKAYTWRVEWGPGENRNVARVLLDGVEIMSVDYSRPYQPRVHYIELGVQERSESVIDAIYRNFTVVRR